MTKEELKLRQQIADILINLNQQGIEGIQYKIVSGYIDDIFTFLREAGWKPPDQIPNATICPKCNEMHWIK
jgi:hypothetical protein